MKMTKGGKVMDPTDAYRKELRKKELKRNKKERKKVRKVGILKNDPDTLKEQIDKLEAMKADGALDKARKLKKRQLEDTLNLVMKKWKAFGTSAKTDNCRRRRKSQTPKTRRLCLLSPYFESDWSSSTWEARHVQVINRTMNSLISSFIEWFCVIIIIKIGGCCFISSFSTSTTTTTTSAASCQ